MIQTLSVDPTYPQSVLLRKQKIRAFSDVLPPFGSLGSQLIACSRQAARTSSASLLKLTCGCGNAVPIKKIPGGANQPGQQRDSRASFSHLPTDSGIHDENGNRGRAHAYRTASLG